MTRFNNPLDKVRVASPCNADWEQMTGNDRARFCGQCNLNVYNLSDMASSEAELLIGRNEGRLCVRYYRRADGSILTRDCPIGLRAIRRRMSYLARAVSSAVLSFFAGLGMYEMVSRLSMMNPPLRREVMGVMAIDPKVLPVLQGRPAKAMSNLPTEVMGDLVVFRSKKSDAGKVHQAKWLR